MNDRRTQSTFAHIVSWRDIASVQEYEQTLAMFLVAALKSIGIRVGQRLVEFGIFGSLLREDFKSNSDIDVLVTFASNSKTSLFDLAQMQIELEELFGRPVDILEKEGLRNPFRKREILKTTKVIYSA